MSFLTVLVILRLFLSTKPIPHLFVILGGTTSGSIVDVHKVVTAVSFTGEEYHSHTQIVLSIVVTASGISPSSLTSVAYPGGFVSNKVYAPGKTLEKRDI